MIWKECGRKRSYLSLNSYSGICLEVLRKTSKYLNQNSRSPITDLNPGSPEYERDVPDATFGELVSN
jgi:hypothetical protein